jgi:hypothetical protein
MAARDPKLRWACGGDPKLECRRYINGGGFGDVYEVVLFSPQTYRLQ